MKIVLWEYTTLDLPMGVTRKELVKQLNTMGDQGWEVVLVRDREVVSLQSRTVRLVALFKRPCGMRDHRII